MYENGDSFRRHVDLERYGINPTVGIQAGPDTRIDLSYEYLHDRRTTDRGVPSDARGGAARSTIRSSRSTASTRPSSAIPTRASPRPTCTSPSWRSSISFAEGLTLRNRTLYGDYDKFYQNIFPNGAGQRRRHGRAVGLQRRNRPQESVQPDRPDLGEPARRDRPDPAVRLRAGPAEERATSAATASSSRRGATSPVVPSMCRSDGRHRCRRFASSTVTADGQQQDQGQCRRGLHPGPDPLSPMFEIVAGLRFDRFELEVDQPQQWRRSSAGPTISGRRASA